MNTPSSVTIRFIFGAINRSHLRRAVVLLATASFAISPPARAVTPAPDGGYPGFNTAEGTNALFSLTTGVRNTAAGNKSLYRNTTGVDNTATGHRALEENITGDSNTGVGGFALLSNTSGSYNTATGVSALQSNTTADHNTANGYNALLSNTTGHHNTSTGAAALINNTIGNYNTANGVGALDYNKSGSRNTAGGYSALYSNSTGYDNTSTGAEALYSNTIGYDNTADGVGALNDNTTGSRNTAGGYYALFSNTTGSNNTANGVGALNDNTTGIRNTAGGYNALFYNTIGSHNMANGAVALLHTTGSFNIGVGDGAGKFLTTGNNNIDIGNGGVTGESNAIRIGTAVPRTGGYGQNTTFIAGITGVAVSGSQVVIDSNGQLGVAVSSARYKKAIKPMDKASETLLRLEPVTFRYKEEIDPDGIPQFGLVAEQVEKVNPDLVVRDADGKVNTVRYEAVNAMLLNEFLKEHREVEGQRSTITELKLAVAKQQKQIEALTAGLQKVSDQTQLNKSNPRVVASEQ